MCIIDDEEMTVRTVLSEASRDILRALGCEGSGDASTQEDMHIFVGQKGRSKAAQYSTPLKKRNGRGGVTDEVINVQTEIPLIGGGGGKVKEGAFSGAMCSESMTGMDMYRWGYHIDPPTKESIKRKESKKQLEQGDSRESKDNLTAGPQFSPPEAIWDVIKGRDAFGGDNAHTMSASDIEACKREGITRGYDAFVVYQGKAYFRSQRPTECRANLMLEPNATLYLRDKDMSEGVQKVYLGCVAEDFPLAPPLSFVPDHTPEGEFKFMLPFTPLRRAGDLRVTVEFEFDAAKRTLAQFTDGVLIKVHEHVAVQAGDAKGDAASVRDLLRPAVYFEGIGGDDGVSVVAFNGSCRVGLSTRLRYTTGVSAGLLLPEGYEFGERKWWRCSDAHPMIRTPWNDGNKSNNSNKEEYCDRLNDDCEAMCSGCQRWRAVHAPRRPHTLVGQEGHRGLSNAAGGDSDIDLTSLTLAKFIMQEQILKSWPHTSSSWKRTALSSNDAAAEATSVKNNVTSTEEWMSGILFVLARAASESDEGKRATLLKSLPAFPVEGNELALARGEMKAEYGQGLAFCRDVLTWARGVAAHDMGSASSSGLLSLAGLAGGLERGGFSRNSTSIGGGSVGGHVDGTSFYLQGQSFSTAVACFQGRNMPILKHPALSLDLATRQHIRTTHSSSHSSRLLRGHRPQSARRCSQSTSSTSSSFASSSVSYDRMQEHVSDLEVTHNDVQQFGSIPLCHLAGDAAFLRGLSAASITLLNQIEGSGGSSSGGSSSSSDGGGAGEGADGEDETLKELDSMLGELCASAVRGGQMTAAEMILTQHINLALAFDKSQDGGDGEERSGGTRDVKGGKVAKGRKKGGHGPVDNVEGTEAFGDFAPLLASAFPMIAGNKCKCHPERESRHNHIRSGRGGASLRPGQLLRHLRRLVDKIVALQAVEQGVVQRGIAEIIAQIAESDIVGCRLSHLGGGCLVPSFAQLVQTIVDPDFQGALRAFNADLSGPSIERIRNNLCGLMMRLVRLSQIRRGVAAVRKLHNHTENLSQQILLHSVSRGGSIQAAIPDWALRSMMAGSNSESRLAGSSPSDDLLRIRDQCTGWESLKKHVDKAVRESPAFEQLGRVKDQDRSALVGGLLLVCGFDKHAVDLLLKCTCGTEDSGGRSSVSGHGKKGASQKNKTKGGKMRGLCCCSEKLAATITALLTSIKRGSIFVDASTGFAHSSIGLLGGSGSGRGGRRGRSRGGAGAGLPAAQLRLVQHGAMDLVGKNLAQPRACPSLLLEKEAKQQLDQAKKIIDPIKITYKRKLGSWLEMHDTEKRKKLLDDLFDRGFSKVKTRIDEEARRVDDKLVDQAIYGAKEDNDGSRVSYSSSPSSSAWVFAFDPRLLLFEVATGFMLWEQQHSLINKFASRGLRGESGVYECIMGSGKTAVIAPVLALMLPNKDQLFMQVVPKQLLKQSKDQMKRTFGDLIPRKVDTFEFDRSVGREVGKITGTGSGGEGQETKKNSGARISSTVSFPGLQARYRMLDTARKERSVVCTAPSSIKSLLLVFIETLLEASKVPSVLSVPRQLSQQFLADNKGSKLTKEGAYERLQAQAHRTLVPVEVKSDVLQSILELLRGKSVALVDEVDLVLHPLTSELNFPIGGEEPLDLAPERWELPMHLMDSVFFAVHGRATSPWQSENSDSGTLGKIQQAFSRGFRKCAMQREPHPVLLDTKYYREQLMVLLAQWVLEYAMPPEDPVTQTNWDTVIGVNMELRARGLLWVQCLKSRGITPNIESIGQTKQTKGKGGGGVRGGGRGEQGKETKSGGESKLDNPPNPPPLSSQKSAISSTTFICTCKVCSRHRSYTRVSRNATTTSSSSGTSEPATQDELRKNLLSYVTGGAGAFGADEPPTRAEQKQKDDDAKQWLQNNFCQKDENNSAVALLNLARQWIVTLLPHILSKRNRVEYGLLDSKGACKETVKGRILLAVPFVGKDLPSPSSEFASPEVVLGLTILAYRYEGLRERDFDGGSRFRSGAKCQIDTGTVTTADGGTRETKGAKLPGILDVLVEQMRRESGQGRFDDRDTCKLFTQWKKYALEWPANTVPDSSVLGGGGGGGQQVQVPPLQLVNGDAEKDAAYELLRKTPQVGKRTRLPRFVVCAFDQGHLTLLTLRCFLLPIGIKYVHRKRSHKCSHCPPLAGH